MNKQHESRWMKTEILPEWAGLTVEDVLVNHLQVSRRMIQRLTRRKGIRYNDKPTFLKRAVKAGGQLEFSVEQGVNQFDVETQAPIVIVYEDEDLLVVNKPVGVNAHPIQPGDSHTLVHQIQYYYHQHGKQATVRPVHRLDRDTSGLLLVAKSDFAHQHLDRQLRNRTLQRRYMALVYGIFADETGTIAAPIGKDPSRPNRRMVTSQGDRAVTEYRVLRQWPTPRASLVECALETGRTHQIRVHLAHIQHPILGDRQYGGHPQRAIPRAALPSRQALHAHQLSCTHPRTGEPMEWECELPEDIKKTMTHLDQLEKESPPTLPGLTY